MAPAGTVAVICVALTTVKLAASAVEADRLAALKPVPVKVTVPTGPEVGAKLVSVGAGMTVKSCGAGGRAARGGDGDRCRSWRRPARWRVICVSLLR